MSCKSEHKTQGLKIFQIKGRIQEKVRAGKSKGREKQGKEEQGQGKARARKIKGREEQGQGRVGDNTKASHYCSECDEYVCLADFGQISHLGV